MCDTPHLNPCGIPLLNVGRDVHGRFTKANPGGPGNPFARKVAALRKALLDSVSEQDVKDMVETLKREARQGDTAAIKLILQYCVGKPESVKDPDRMDVDEWDRLQQMRVSQEQFTQTRQSIPACLACHLAQSHWPCEAQDGPPLAETIADVHSQLQAAAQAAPAEPATIASPNGARPEAPARPDAAFAAQTKGPNAPTESAPTAATRPSSAKGTRESSDRHEPAAGRSKRNGHSQTPQPSPNGGNGQGQRQAREHPQRLRQPPQPSGQTHRKPPRG